ncbi:MAG: murein hydrolase activator EnvC family protein [Bdellovibrionota bacterium]
MGGVIRPFLFLVSLVGIVGGVFYRGTLVNFLESEAPFIESVFIPEGIGVEGAEIILRVRDDGAGIDEIVVRAQQHGIETELLRQSLGGVSEQEFRIPLDGEGGRFREGKLDLLVRAFDRSFWSNGDEVELSLVVDYQTPKLEVITTQHNARVGGAQLLIYRASDGDLVESGVRVGDFFFRGYPARQLDAALTEPDLYAVIYAIPFRGRAVSRYKISAEAKDRSGNLSKISFYSKEAPARVSTQQVALSNACLQGKVSEVFRSSENILREAVGDGELERIRSLPGLEASSEQFRLVSEQLRMFDSAHLAELTKISGVLTFERQPFQKQHGIVRYAHQQKLSFTTNGKALSELWHRGYFYRMRPGAPEVVAASGGTVAFVEELGTFGTVVGIDHGLGVFSIYGDLQQVQVKAGDEVEGESVLGFSGQGVFGCERGTLFQVRVQGVPVEPAEWLSAQWHTGHITRKVASAKRLLGLATPVSF